MTVVATNSWKNNAELIKDVAKLGYLDGHVLDCTYGLGRFWSAYRPENLTKMDLNPDRDVDLVADVRHLPFRARSFDAVVWDGPYRLNGTPDQAFDGDYGIQEYTTWQQRMALIVLGSVCCGILTRKYLLVKVQDQVCSGQVRWMTDYVTRAVEQLGLRKKDRFDIVTPVRPQPEGRKQIHARRNSSTLLVFTR